MIWNSQLAGILITHHRGQNDRRDRFCPLRFGYFLFHQRNGCRLFFWTHQAIKFSFSLRALFHSTVNGKSSASHRRIQLWNASQCPGVGPCGTCRARSPFSGRLRAGQNAGAHRSVFHFILIQCRNRITGVLHRRIPQICRRIHNPYIL